MKVIPGGHAEKIGSSSGVDLNSFKRKLTPMERFIKNIHKEYNESLA